VPSGLDALFERGYIHVEDGIVRIKRTTPSLDLTQAARLIADLPASFSGADWSHGRAKYFRAREESIRVAAERKQRCRGTGRAIADQ
jgi:hypothetical protein